MKSKYEAPKIELALCGEDVMCSSVPDTDIPANEEDVSSDVTTI